MTLTRPPLVTLSNCDQERIHAPGSIQPHGFMLVIEAESGRIAGCSRNVPDFFSREPSSLIGLDVGEVIDRELLPLLSEARQDPAFRQRAMFLKTATLKPAGDRGSPLALVAHQSGEFIILEGEPAGDPSAGRIDTHLQSFLDQFPQAGTLPEIFQLAVQEMRRITGFDRCLLYRFDADWNGSVIAEDRNGALPSYLNHHFPASDIPLPARELYAKNRIRLIPTHTYRPAALIMGSDQKHAGNLDLTFSTLRSVSPIHLEYMRNMGTGSAMSVSILSNGHLWGLLSCHSAGSHWVPFMARTSCDLLGQFLSSQIATRDQAADLALRTELSGISARLLRSLATDKTPGESWTDHDLLAIARAHGAALIAGDTVKRIGTTPAPEQLLRLREYVKAQPGGFTFWNKIPEELSTVFGAEPAVSGMLGLALSGGAVVMWFRPETIQVIEWSGDPRKAIDRDGEGRTFLHPRKSFEAWKETVRGRALPWERAVVSAARDFQSLAAGLDRVSTNDRTAIT